MSEQEFADIVHRTKATVLAAIARNLPSQYHHAIDDIAQETYIRAYKSLLKQRYAENGKMHAWLYEIAKNETLRMIKRMGHHERIAEKAVKEYQKPARPDDISAEFTGLVEKLPLKYRPVVELAVQGYSEQEIADKLNIPIGTVKSRKSRGKELIYKILKKEELEYDRKYIIQKS